MARGRRSKNEKMTIQTTHPRARPSVLLPTQHHAATPRVGRISPSNLPLPAVLELRRSWRHRAGGGRGEGNGLGQMTRAVLRYTPPNSSLPAPDASSYEALLRMRDDPMCHSTPCISPRGSIVWIVRGQPRVYAHAPLHCLQLSAFFLLPRSLASGNKRPARANGNWGLRQTWRPS